MIQRRNFLSTAALIAGGVAAAPLRSLAATPCLSTPEEDVLRLIETYGSLAGPADRKAEGKKVVFRTRVKSHAAFAQSFSAADAPGAGNLHAEGNLMTFQHRGVDFLIKHLA